MKIDTINLINSIKSNKLSKKIISVKNKKNTIEIIKKLVEIGIIKNFEINNLNILFKLNNKYKIKDIIIISKPSLLVTKKIKNIKINKNSIDILSCNKGIITSIEAIERKIGGEILFRVKK